MAVAQKEDVIKIDWRDSRLVFISSKDEDRFMKTCQEVAEACRRMDDFATFYSTFKSMLSRVHQWAQDNQKAISKCYVGVRDGQQVIFVVPEVGRFDFAVSDSLTRLDLELADAFGELHCEVMQVPAMSKETLLTFLDPTKAILIYGD